MNQVEPVPVFLVWIKFVCIFHLSFLFHSLCFGVLKLGAFKIQSTARQGKAAQENKINAKRPHESRRSRKKNTSKYHIIISFAKFFVLLT